MQRALIQYRNPKNYELVEEALRLAHREDLIGFDKKCLIRPRKFGNAGMIEKAGASGKQTDANRRGQTKGDTRKLSQGNRSSSKDGTQRGKGTQNAGVSKSPTKKKTIRNTHAKKK